MSVRAKFRLNSVTIDQRSHRVYENGRPVEPARYETMEQRTFNFTPVMPDDESPENRAFWDASPSGSLQLGVVNEGVWPFFEIGEEYYLDFTKAE